LKGSDIRIDGVVKNFGKFQALKDISLEIKKGEFFSLLGPSGCGKTTLLRIIAGFETPDAGAVTFDGRDVLGLPPNKRHANTIFQSYALFPHLSIFENVAFPLRLKKMKSEALKTKVMDYLGLVELADHAHKMPAQLSGGQRQRVAIARALINEPSVLLLDEPLSALDAKLRHHMLMELDDIHDKIGITFVFVTHDQTEALSVSDRIAVFDQGHVLQVGTPHEIYETPQAEFVAQFVGETNLFPGTVTGVENGLYALDLERVGKVLVTDERTFVPGQKITFTVRPEKLRISQEKPAVNGKAGVNVFEGRVDEPVYTGFQSKYSVRHGSGVDFKVYHQHASYEEEESLIAWKEKVWVSWSANDGFIVGPEAAG
jgi:spermidine/putrescine transport system ATP-binding protein